LSLTVEQASRLWALEVDTCRDVLGVLLDAGLLVCRGDGRFVLSPRSVDQTGAESGVAARAT
jgi:hypothetical protein